MSTYEAMRNFEEELTALENSHDSDSAPGELRPEPRPHPRPPAPLPQGAQPLLEAQLGEALKMLRNFSDWVYLPDAHVGDCIRAGDAVSRLMTSSAMIGTVVARLQKGEPESRHRMIVEHVRTPAGEGAKKVENE